MTCAAVGSRTFTVNFTGEINRYIDCQMDPGNFNMKWLHRVGSAGSFQQVATSNSNDIGPGGTLTITLPGISLAESHTIRLVTKYGNMNAEVRDFNYQLGGEVTGPSSVNVGQQRIYEFINANGPTVMGTWQAFPSGIVNITSLGSSALVEFLAEGTGNLNYATSICGIPLNFPIDVVITQTGGSGCVVCLTNGGADGLNIPTTYNMDIGQPLQINGLGNFEENSLQYELVDMSGRRLLSGSLIGNIDLSNPAIRPGMHVLRVVSRGESSDVLTQKLLVY